MQKLLIRYVILIIILIIFSLSTIWLQVNQPKHKTDVDISKIPLNVGDWKGEEILVDRQTKDVLETDSVLMRRYVNIKNNERIDLAVVYYKNNRIAFHLPESCLLGHGSRLTNREIEKINLPNGKNFYATKLSIKNDVTNNLVVYYFESGTLRSSSYLSFRWQILLNKLRGRSTSGALVRFSIFSIGDNSQNNLDTLKEFISEIEIVLPRYLM